MKIPNPNRLPLFALPFLILCASAFAGSDAHHPGRGWGPPDPERHVARLTEELGLDEEQAAELLEIFTAAETERETLRAHHEELIRKDMCALFDGVDDQVREVLTPTQQAGLDELRASFKARREEHLEGDDSSRNGRHRKDFPDCDETAS